MDYEAKSSTPVDTAATERSTADILLETPTHHPIAARAKNPVVGWGMMIEHAIANDLDIAKFEKLLDIQRAAIRDQARAAFYRSLAAFQAELTPVPCTKWADMKTWGFWYADLGDLIRHCSPLLGKHALSYFWSSPEYNHEGDYFLVACTAAHRDGYSLPPVQMISYPERHNDQTKQKQNLAAVTTGQRKSFSLALGIVSEREAGKEDGPLRGGGGTAARGATAGRPSGGGGAVPATEGQLKLIAVKLDQAGIPETDYLKKFNIDDPSKIQKQHVDRVLAWIKEVAP